MEKTPPNTIRIPKSLGDQYRRLADRSKQPTEAVIATALSEYLAAQAWRDKETRKGLLELEKGDIASVEEVQLVFDKWLKRDGNPMDQLGT